MKLGMCCNFVETPDKLIVEKPIWTTWVRTPLTVKV